MTHLAHGRAAAAVVAVLTLAGCTTDDGPPDSDVPASEPAHRLLFQAQGATHLVVATAQADGTGIVYPLEDLPGGDQTNPDWSPDGSRIVFVLDDGARDDLWIADADGGDPRVLLDCAGTCRYLDDPAWSPDGRVVAYSRTQARGAHALGSLETVDVDTGQVQEWLHPRFRHFTAGVRWSPDGTAVVFESIHTDSRRLDAEVDEVVLRVLEVGSHRASMARTAPAQRASTAAWSPDGDRIAYSGLATPDAEGAELFVMPAGHGSPRQVTSVVRHGGYADEATWADDVTLVFSGRFEASFGGAGLLLQVNTSSGAVAPIGDHDVIGRHPRLAPDG